VVVLKPAGGKDSAGAGTLEGIDPLDTPAAAADVISSGGRSLPSWTKPRRWQVGLLVLAAAVGGITAFVMRSTPAPPVTTQAASGAGGVFAQGTAGSQRWRLAVRDIAGPGYQCVPGVTLNGADATPVTPAAIGRPAFIEVGRAAGFGFVQVPADADLVWTDPADGVRISTTPVTVTTCGQRFRLAGFAYPLTATLRVHVGYTDHPAATLSTPLAVTDPRPTLAEPEVAGIWQVTGAPAPTMATAVLTAGRAVGEPWSIRVMFGPAGDCFALVTGYIDDSVNARPDSDLTCAPVSTPGGPDQIVALPLAASAEDGPGTGYAFSLGPGTSRLIGRLSGGHTVTARPVVVDGREYAAFFVPATAQLTRLTFVTSHGTRSTTGLPEFGYVQFQA
jgi:hypothetical protein